MNVYPYNIMGFDFGDEDTKITLTCDQLGQYNGEDKVYFYCNCEEDSFHDLSHIHCKDLHIRTLDKKLRLPEGLKTLFIDDSIEITNDSAFRGMQRIRSLDSFKDDEGNMHRIAGYAR